MDTSKIVGEKIKSLREDKSITIEELAAFWFGYGTD